jgi:hypothetical protein
MKTYFIPTTLAQASVDYSRPRAEDVSRLAQALRRPAIGFGKDSKKWRQRAVKAWHAVAREWERWKFPEAEDVLAQLAANTRTSLPVLRESVANHFRVIEEEPMRDWLEEVHETRAEDETRTKYPPLAFIIAPGNIPGAALQPVVQFSLLGIPTLIKSAGSEPHLMPALLESLARRDEEVAARLAALSWPRENVAATQAVLEAAPQVVAFGDDDTMAKLRTQSGESLMPFGDRFSAAIVHAAKVKLPTLRKLVYDYAMFDGKGCLSPQAIFALADEWEQVEKLAVHLAGVLSEENKKWPPGNWSLAEKALIQQWRGAWQARAAAGEHAALYQAEDAAWTVVAADEFDLNERVAFRCVRLWWMKSFEEVMLVLKNYTTKLQALAVEVTEHEHARLALDLDEEEDVLGRLICEPGTLQRPFFSWMASNKQWFELTYGVKL